MHRQNVGTPQETCRYGDSTVQSINRLVYYNRKWTESEDVNKMVESQKLHRQWPVSRRAVQDARSRMETALTDFDEAQANAAHCCRVSNIDGPWKLVTFPSRTDKEQAEYVESVKSQAAEIFKRAADRFQGEQRNNPAKPKPKWRV